MLTRKRGLIVLAITLLTAAMPVFPVSADGPEQCPNGTDVTGACLPETTLSALELRSLDAEIAAHPHPDVTSLPVDESALYNRNYQRVLQQVTIYDGPNGNPIGTLDPGFNFFTTLNRVDNWVEVNHGQWVQEEYLGGARVSHFTGVLLDEPPPYPLAWILLDTRASQRPGAYGYRTDPMLTRYTMVNIFATAVVDGWEWYLVGPNQWVHQTRIARVIPVQRPEGVSGRWVAVDLYEQILIAYEEDRMVFATLVSSGLPDWATNEGLFRIWSRFPSTPMSGAEGLPDFYYLEEVPWTMFFDDGISLHGTYWHDGFGYRHSHGCVNMTITDSQWVYQWTEDYPDAFVYVYSSGEYR